MSVYIVTNRGTIVAVYNNSLSAQLCKAETEYFNEQNGDKGFVEVQVRAVLDKFVSRY